MVLIERSVETPRYPSIAARSLAGPISRRPCRRADLEEASNRRCPVYEDTQQDLESASYEEVVNDESWQSDINLERMECRDIQIYCMAAKSVAEPLEACRP
jgi:hypothetical protein